MIDSLASPPSVWRLGGEVGPESPNASIHGRSRLAGTVSAGPVCAFSVRDGYQRGGDHSARPRRPPHRNDRWIPGVAAAILGGLLAASPCWAQLLDTVVARVDQSVVTLSQVVQERELKRWAGDAGASLELNAVADLLVRRRLVVAEAAKMRLEASAEEVAADLERLVSSGGRPAEFWERVAAVGLTEADIRRRCREVLLTRQYLSIRQEMTYVPEAEVRAYVAAREGADGSRASPEGREAVRALLARQKYEQELHQWVARQLLEGRVRMAGEMELERFWQSSPPLR